MKTHQTSDIANGSEDAITAITQPNFNTLQKWSYDNKTHLSIR